MRNILKSHICMVCDVKADRTVVMGKPVLMVMKRKQYKGERQTDKQGQGKFSLHWFKIKVHLGFQWVLR